MASSSRRGKRSSVNGQSRKLKFDSSMDESEILHWVRAAADQTQYTTLGFDEVAVTPAISAAMVDLFRRTSRYGRVFDRLSVEFCDGFGVDLLLTTPIILDGVKHLYVATEKPEDDLIGRVAITLRVNTSLRSLWLLVPFTEISAESLARALGENETLEKLSLSGSNFDKLDDEEEDDDDDDKTKSDVVSVDTNEFNLFSPLESSMALCEGLRDNASLKILDLSCCYLRDEVLAQIIAGLGGHPSLQTLDVSRNAARDLSMHALAAVVGHHDCKLVSLDLREQTDDVSLEISELAQALKSNATIEILKLSHNRLKDRHVMRLVECLEGNDSLQELDLQYNQITEDGLNYLTEHLGGMKSLAVLLLGGNAFGADGRNLLESLQDDDSVCTVNEKELAKKKKNQNVGQKPTKGSGLKSGGGFAGFSGLMGGNFRGTQKSQPEGSC